MLRKYIVQECFGLSDEGMEDAVYDSQAILRFIGIDLSVDTALDAITLLKFHRLLETHNLTKVVFGTISGHLAAKGLLLKERRSWAPQPSQRLLPQRTGLANATRTCTRQRREMSGVCHEHRLSLWCCTEDGGRPPGAGLQEQASNRPVLLRSKDVVVSDRGKVVL